MLWSSSPAIANPSSTLASAVLDQIECESSHFTGCWLACAGTCWRQESLCDTQSARILTAQCDLYEYSARPTKSTSAQMTIAEGICRQVTTYLSDVPSRCLPLLPALAGCCTRRSSCRLHCQNTHTVKTHSGQCASTTGSPRSRRRWNRHSPSNTARSTVASR